MSGSELKAKIDKFNLVQADIARKMSMTPQDLSSKLNSKRLKADFLNKVELVFQQYGYTLFDKDEELANQSDNYLYKLVKEKDNEIRELRDRITDLTSDNTLLKSKLREYMSERAIFELLKKVG